MKIDDELQQKLLLRDNGQCCLTGAIPSGAEAQPFLIISPALQRLWLSQQGYSSVLSCLEALITPENANVLRQILGDASLYGQLKNAMLLNPTVGQALWKRDIWLTESTQSSKYSQAHTECQTQEQHVCTVDIPFIIYANKRRSIRLSASLPKMTFWARMQAMASYFSNAPWSQIIQNYYHSPTQCYSRFIAALRRRPRQMILTGKWPSLGRQFSRIVCHHHLGHHRAISLLIPQHSLLESQMAASISTSLAFFPGLYSSLGLQTAPLSRATEHHFRNSI